MATQIVELSGDEAALLRSYQKSIEKALELERRTQGMGDTGDAAGTKFRESLSKVQQQSDKMLNGLLRDLGKLGPEGSATADALSSHFQETGKAGRKSMQEIIAEIRKIDPEAAEAASTAQAAFASSANSTEAQYRDVLAEMRKLGPQGKQAADEIQKELVSAGKISERSMADVVAELEKLDPAAAKQAREIAKSMDGAANRGKLSFSAFGAKAIAEIGSIVTAYIGVREAIELVNGFLEKQNELLNSAKETQIELARAQQESAKNLAGLTLIERNQLLRDAVPAIAGQTGFSDLSEITQALGAVASAGESNAQAIQNAVLQAARIELLTPQKLDSTASASSAVQRQAGLDDIRQAIALVETTGTQARIVNPQQLADALPKAVGSSVATVRGQDSTEAARQAAALFAQITQGGNDEQGKSSATFVTDFTSRMLKFFSDLEQEQIEARSKVDLIDRKIAKGSETEANRKTREDLLAFLAASEGVQDSGTLFGRLGQLQSSQALADQFKGEGFGEKQFTTVLDDLLSAESDRSRALQESFKVIQADVEFFEREAATLSGSTPQLALATAQARSQGTIAQRFSNDTEGAALSQVREIVGNAMVDTAPTFLESFSSGLIARGSLGGGTAAEELLSGINELGNRIIRLEEGGLTPREQLDVTRLTQDIDTLFSFFEASAQQGALNPEGVDAARSRAEAAVDRPAFTESVARSNALMARMVEVLERIDESNSRTAANTEVAPRAVTPALSSNQP